MNCNYCGKKVGLHKDWKKIAPGLKVYCKQCSKLFEG